MSTLNLRDGTAENLLLNNLKPLGAVVTLAGAYVLGAEDAAVQLITPGGGTRTVDLPLAANAKNKMFIISNRGGATESLTIRLAGGGATVATLVGSATPVTSETGVFWCDGTTWRSLITATYKVA